MSKNNRVENSWILMTKESLLSNSSFTIITLPHPAHGGPVKYCLDDANHKMYEIISYKESLRSWFIDDSVKSDGTFLMGTPIDPLFLVLPRLRAQCGDRAIPLEDLLSERGFDKIVDYVVNLDKIADLKGPADVKAYKYNEEKTLNWLESKVRKLAKFLKDNSADIPVGAVSATFISSTLNNDTVSDELGLKHACNIVCEYLQDDFIDKLYKHFDFDTELIEQIGNKRKLEVENTDDGTNKRSRTNKSDVPVYGRRLEEGMSRPLTSTPIYGLTSEDEKRQPLTAKAKALQKASSGLLSKLQSQCGGRALPLEDLFKRGFGKNVDYSVNLDRIADLKGLADNNACKYNEDEMLNLLESKVRKLAKFLILKNTQVIDGALSITFVTTCRTVRIVSAEFYHVYACQIISDYIQDDLADKLYKRFDFKREFIEQTGHKRPLETKNTDKTNRISIRYKTGSPTLCTCGSISEEDCDVSVDDLTPEEEISKLLTTSPKDSKISEEEKSQPLTTSPIDSQIPEEEKSQPLTANPVDNQTSGEKSQPLTANDKTLQKAASELLSKLQPRCGGRALPLEDLFKRGFGKNVDYSVNLDRIADLKGLADINACKYYEHEMLNLLESKVRKLAKFLIMKNMQVIDGAVSITFVPTCRTVRIVSAEFYHMYACQIISDYLQDDLADKLYKRFDFKKEFIEQTGHKRPLETKNTDNTNRISIRYRTGSPTLCTCGSISDEDSDVSIDDLTPEEEICKLLMARHTDSQTSEDEIESQPLTTKDKTLQKAASGFTVLPRLQAECDDPVVLLEDFLIERGFDNIGDEIANLDKIADLKVPADINAYKYNEEKKFKSLISMTHEIANFLRKYVRVCIAGRALSSSDTVSDDICLLIACEILSKHLRDHAMDKLYNHFDFNKELMEQFGNRSTNKKNRVRITFRASSPLPCFCSSTSEDSDVSVDNQTSEEKSKPLTAID